MVEKINKEIKELAILDAIKEEIKILENQRDQHLENIKIYLKELGRLL